MVKKITANDIWWKTAVLYQIYPRSFYDADNNGIGDLKGITQKLDHLNNGNGGGLGIDGIWISPFFKSPMADFGYDVSDYCEIDPIFGTLEDYDELIHQAHKRGIKILIDLVLNHTSDQHSWFQESKISRENKKADWYVWANPNSDGGPPNNWLSIFGGPAWTYNKARDQYYFHNFLKEQPDLNWYCQEVREEISRIIQFWVDRKTDGFRLDTANFYAFDQQLRDNPLISEVIDSVEDTDFNPYFSYDTVYSKDRPDNIDFIHMLRSCFDKGHEITSIGEVGGISDLEKVIQVAADHARGDNRLHMAYTFSLLNDKADIYHIARVISITESKMSDGWPCWSLGNHDIKRLKTRYDCVDEKEGLEQAFLLFLLSIRGTPVLYYGDEISMEDMDITKEELQDPYGIRFWPKFKGRDGCRTPFAWDSSSINQGFNQGQKPWLPAKNSSSLDNNLADPNSTFYVVRDMIKIRKKFKSLSLGTYRQIHCNSTTLVFERCHDNERILSAINIGLRDQTIALPVGCNCHEDLPIKSYRNNGKIDKGILHLPPMGFYLGVYKNE